MKYKTLVRLALKLMGVFFILQGAVELVDVHLYELSRTYYSYNFFGLWWYGGIPSDDLLDFFLSHLPAVLRLLAGLYLFFGGKWIVNKIIPSNRPYCHECGFDLSGQTGHICPECGTAHRVPSSASEPNTAGEHNTTTPPR